MVKKWFQKEKMSELKYSGEKSVKQVIRWLKKSSRIEKGGGLGPDNSSVGQESKVGEGSDN